MTQKTRKDIESAEKNLTLWAILALAAALFMVMVPVARAEMPSDSEIQEAIDADQKLLETFRNDGPAPCDDQDCIEQDQEESEEEWTESEEEWTESECGLDCTGTDPVDDMDSSEQIPDSSLASCILECAAATDGTDSEVEACDAVCSDPIR